MSIDDVEFEEKEMKKIRSVKNTWYDWLITFIAEPIRKNAGGFTDRVINFISSKDTVEKRVMHLRSGNIRFTSYNDASCSLFESLQFRNINESKCGGS